MAAVYKYNCRKCPIRNRCISESRNSSSVKKMLRHAFDAKTDTLTAWNRLQTDCLLAKAEEERKQKSSGDSMLSRRLRKAREDEEQEPPASSPPQYLQPVKSSSSEPPKIKRFPSATRPKLKSLSSKSDSKPVARQGGRSQDEPEWMVPASTTKESTQDIRHSYGASNKTEETSPQKKVESARPYWLTMAGGTRHIALPADGEIVIGRFDPNIGIPPDIDLGLEDEVHTISRRHAKIIAVDGYHTIEDLGSRHGLSVNGVVITAGVRHKLETGDRLRVGQLKFLYDAVPTHILIISSGDKVRHRIIVTSTGTELEIKPPDDIILGRQDTYVDSVPDIDLSQEGEIAARVSRRHTLITWRGNMPYVEDLGSGFGTRLNGQMMLMGQAIALKPGDHIWLAGCVLAYDVEL